MPEAPTKEREGVRRVGPFPHYLEEKRGRGPCGRDELKKPAVDGREGSGRGPGGLREMKAAAAREQQPREEEEEGRRRRRKEQPLLHAFGRRGK